jgi:hypothetical protein
MASDTGCKTPQVDVPNVGDNFEITWSILVSDAHNIPFRLGFTHVDPVDLKMKLEPPRADWSLESDMAIESAGLKKQTSGNSWVYLPGHERYLQLREHYLLTLTIFAGEDGHPPRVSAYSNEGDNRQAWELAFYLGFGLAERIGRLELDETASETKEVNEWR